ncbi:unnamed protein product [Ectocarpus sp. 12 AP-2014]
MGRVRQEENLREPFAAGNIAQVLRQARASLKEPSRPFTPTERRIRSTKSLFGEIGFRPTKNDLSEARRNGSGLAGRKIGPDHVERSRRGGGRCGKGKDRRRQANAVLPSGIVTAVPPEGAVYPSPGWQSAVNTMLHGEGHATKQFTGHATSSRVSVLNNSNSYSSGCSSSSAKRGRRHLGGGENPNGSRSRSIDNQWGNSSKRSCSIGSSSSSSSTTSNSTTSITSNNNRTSTNKKRTGGARKVAEVSAPPDYERDGYGGLYGSDDDIDTTAWDPGSICSGTLGDHDEQETSPASPSLGSAGDDAQCLGQEFILDAIDNEVDLSRRDFGFDDDDEEDVAGQSYTQSIPDDDRSDGPPDPGALEGQRERSARLTGLLQMFSRHLDHANEEERARGSHTDGAKRENQGSTDVGASTARALVVLSRVMDRPLRAADASPTTVTELPALLAARLVVALVLRLPLPPPRSSKPTEEEDVAEGDGWSARQQLLVKACRHMFEVSKKPDADEAFFSSGAVTGILEFVELSASHLDSMSGASFRKNPERERKRPELESVEYSIACIGDADAHNSSNRTSCSSSSTADDSNASSDRDLGGCVWHVGGIYDSLTFSVGCVKNISAEQGLRDRLVQAGSIRALCRLVRSTRDLCSRCERSQKQQEEAIQTSLRRVPTTENEEQTKAADDVKESADLGGGEVGIGEQDEKGLDCVDLLRRRVSPLLAQAIGLVRDLAVDETNDRVRAAGFVSTLCSIFRPFRNHQDVVLNTARALARLSLHQPTRGLITSEPGHVRDLLAAFLEQGGEIDAGFKSIEEGYKDSSRGTSTTAAVAPVEHRQHWDNQGKRVATCVRIAFALGNLTSASDENRRLIGLRFGGAESLPAFLHTFSRAYLMAWECLCSVETHHAASMDGITETSSSSAWGARGTPAVVLGECWARRTLRRACCGLEEMLVKAVRLLANISIHRDVGQRVCRHPGLVALEPLLGKCLELYVLYEDGALPQAGLCDQQGKRCWSQGGDWGSGAGPAEVATIPGEELLLNAVCLITNLSYYGPTAANCTAASPVGRAPPSFSSTGTPAGVSRVVGRSDGVEPSVSAALGRPPQGNILFALAGKARRDVDEEQKMMASTGGSVEKSARARPDGCFCEEVVGAPALAVTSQSCRPATGSGEYGGGTGGRTREEVLCGHLVKVLLHPNAEAVAEAARAFGNFSRDPSCRRALTRRRADEVLVALIGHPCREVVFAAVGALVNVATDPACKALLCRESVGAGERLARLVRRAGLADPGMAELACQALHNLLIEPGLGVHAVLGSPETFKKLWWTLKELMEACSCEAQGFERHRERDRQARFAAVGGHSRNSPELEGFLAAATAVWRAMNEYSVDGMAWQASFFEEFHVAT